MLESLKTYCSKVINFSKQELNLLDEYFIVKKFKKKEFVLNIDEVCDFIAFINFGALRHFHIKDGNEITCDISFENKFITEFTSFNYGSKSAISIQCLSEAELFVIEKDRLQNLYENVPKFEQFGRKIAEMVALRNSNIAMSLSSDKPEERYKKLLKENSMIFQRVQQKYIANFLGITPESLSRIRKRTLTDKS